MAILLDINVLQKSLGMPPSVTSGVQQRLELAVSQSLALLEAYLLTELDRVERTQLFYVDHCQQAIGPEGAYLKLAAGIVDITDNPPVLTRSRYPHDIDAEGETMQASEYIVDPTKGLILIYPYSGSTFGLPGRRRLVHNRGGFGDYNKNTPYYVRATYTAGCTVDEEGIMITPPWLQAAAMQIAKAVYNDSTMCSDDDDDSPADTSEIVSGIIGKLIERHIRFFPYAVSPTIG